MRIYIAGPVSSLPYAEAVRRFEIARDVIRRDGHHEAVVPLDYTRDIVGHPDEWELSMARVLPLVETCEAIILLRGWEDSRGAKVELKRALELGLVILPEGD